MDIWSGILFALTVISVAMMATTISFFAGDKDNLANVQRNLGIAAGSSTAINICIFIFLYIYIQTHPSSFVPIVIFLLFITLEVAIIAATAAVLQKVS